MAPERALPHTVVMSEPRTGFPPPTPAEAAPTATTPSRWRHPVALFAVAAAIGTVAALITGFAAGALVFSLGSNDCSPSDGWCDLGAAVFGLLAGVVVGTIAYVATGVTTIVRSRPSGRRGGHIAAHLVFPPLAFVTLGVVGELLG